MDTFLLPLTDAVAEKASRCCFSRECSRTRSWRALCWLTVIMRLLLLNIIYTLYAQAVKALREATRAAKREKARLQREKALKAMTQRSQVAFVRSIA